MLGIRHLQDLQRGADHDQHLEALCDTADSLGEGHGGVQTRGVQSQLFITVLFFICFSFYDFISVLFLICFCFYDFISVLFLICFCFSKSLPVFLSVSVSVSLKRWKKVS